MFIPLHDANALKHIRLQYVTLTIIVANIAIWLITGTPAISDQAAVAKTFYAYGFIPAVVNDFQVLPEGVQVFPTAFSYVTYSFFHQDFMHLAGNMLFLWVFGDNVEDAMGHLKYMLFYIACVVAGAWFHAFMAPDSQAPLIGASAAAAGIIAGYLLLHPNVRVWVLVLGRIPLRIPALWAIGAWIAFQFYSLVTDPENQVSWAAHVGGIAMGLIMTPLLKRSSVPLFDRDDHSKIGTAVVDVAPEKNVEDEETMSNASGPPQAATEKRSRSASVPDIKKSGRWGRQ